MAWTTPPTFTKGQLVAASDLNSYVKDNTNYLLNRPQNNIKRDANGGYSTTSTSFVDVDATNLAITLTISGSAIAFGFDGWITGATTGQTEFDVTIDGTRYASGGTDGWIGMSDTSPILGQISGTGLATGLSAGSHTLKLQWRNRTGNTSAMAAGSGTAGQDFLVHFWAVEVG